MKKKVLKVPKGIRYISEWNGFNLPEFSHILDKQITGCGFTEWVITNAKNTILVSPRLILLENKEAQHKGEVFYVRNDLDAVLNVDRDLTKAVTSSKKSQQELSVLKQGIDLEQKKLELMNQVRSYFVYCTENEIPCKLLVTYDSYRIVYEALTTLGSGCFESFYTVVDEFQSIFTDSKFKSSTELDFLNYLKLAKKVCFVSATPMIDEYLNMLDEFKDLPYYELDWESEEGGRVIKPQLTVHPCQRITEMAVNIIKSYQDGNFEKTVIKDSNGNLQEVVSKELVIYVNSVKNICDIIRKAGLTFDNTNVLCSNTPENQKKIRKAFGLKRNQVGGIGSVPLREEKNKMFTLCTRTVYLGADFYSTCARSVILSDANIECLAVDITLDLPQILGRQRLAENPWKDRAELYVRFLSEGNRKGADDFKKYRSEKIKKTENLLLSYDSSPNFDTKHDLAETYQRVAEVDNYKNNYVAVNKHSGKDLLPVFNNLVMVSEMRAFEIQQKDYADRFRILNQIENSGKYIIDPVMNEVNSFIAKFNSMVTFIERMRLLCESNLSESAITPVLRQLPIDYSTYYTSLGPEKIKALGCQKSRLKREYDRVINNTQVSKGGIQTAFYKEFSVGERIAIRDVKLRVQKVYSSIGLEKTAKAVDILEYFEVMRTKVKDSSDNKFINGYEILKIK